MRPVYRGRRPLKATDIHRVIDIVPRPAEDYDDPQWLIRRGGGAAECRHGDAAASDSDQPEHTTTERRRTLSLGALAESRLQKGPIAGGGALLPFPPERHHSTSVNSSSSSRAQTRETLPLLVKPVAPLRIRRNPSRDVIVRDDCTTTAGRHSRDDGPPHAQSLDRGSSNSLPLDGAMSPLQRMTNRLGEWSTRAGLLDDGARLRPGPPARLPVLRRTMTNSSRRPTKPPASSCPPFPPISHSKFDLRCVSQKPGYIRTRLRSSPGSFDLGRTRMLPICQQNSRTDFDKVAGRR